MSPNPPNKLDSELGVSSGPTTQERQMMILDDIKIELQRANDLREELLEHLRAAKGEEVEH